MESAGCALSKTARSPGVCDGRRKYTGLTRQVIQLLLTFYVNELFWTHTLFFGSNQDNFGVVLISEVGLTALSISSNRSKNVDKDLSIICDLKT